MKIYNFQNRKRHLPKITATAIKKSIPRITSTKAGSEMTTFGWRKSKGDSRKPTKEFADARISGTFFMVCCHFACIGIPSKENSFLVCTVFCLERWGEGPSRPSKNYKERYIRLLARYPLPKFWVSVWDAGCEAYYFWNKIDDHVSWLPPKHPKAIIGKSAATLRSEKDRPDLDAMDDEPMLPPPSRSPSHQEENRYQRPAPLQKKTKSRDLEKILRTKKGRKQFHETSDKIDPMDPASYSDCGRGKWSSGLNVDEGKTGVDTTASGQLFQQRPYPSPGEVMRAKRRDSDDDKTGGDGHKRRRYSNEDD